MLLSAARRIPNGDQWAHEPKLDGMRCGVVVVDGRVRVWSRRLRDWTAAIPELAVLRSLPSDTVIDGELVALVGDRPDFEVLMSALNAPKAPRPDGLLTYFAFDLLTLNGRNLRDQSWTTRREQLDSLDLTTLTSGVVRTVAYSDDGAGMHQATLKLGMEGVVCKRRSSRYVPGRPGHAWLKVKHRHREVLGVAGWRPSTPGRRGGLILTDGEHPVGVATLALPAPEKEALVGLIRRYGRTHPTGTITVPDGCLEAVVEFTSRTVSRHLREAIAVAVQPPPASAPLR
jgi:bifunctional non-homologous end joining protein LigD